MNKNITSEIEEFYKDKKYSQIEKEAFLLLKNSTNGDPTMSIEHSLSLCVKALLNYIYHLSMRVDELEKKKTSVWSEATCEIISKRN